MLRRLPLLLPLETMHKTISLLSIHFVYFHVVWSGLLFSIYSYLSLCLVYFWPLFSIQKYPPSHAMEHAGTFHHRELFPCTLHIRIIPYLNARILSAIPAVWSHSISLLVASFPTTCYFFFGKNREQHSNRIKILLCVHIQFNYDVCVVVCCDCFTCDKTAAPYISGWHSCHLLERIFPHRSHEIWIHIYIYIYIDGILSSCLVLSYWWNDKQEIHQTLEWMKQFIQEILVANERRSRRMMMKEKKAMANTTTQCFTSWIWHSTWMNRPVLFLSLFIYPANGFHCHFHLRYGSLL